MVEYALLAGFIAVAAGAVLPTISESIWFIFLKLSCLLDFAANGSFGCGIGVNGNMT